MYLRIVKAAGGQGKTFEYVRLVESYRIDGQTKQRTVFNLGRRDILAAHLDDLNALLRGAPRQNTLPLPSTEALGAWDWGTMLVARTLWRELGIERALDRLGRHGKKDSPTLSDRALVLCANRLCEPTSEHGLARWLETDFVCDRDGRRWMPAWREDEERLQSRLPRVKVEFRQLHMWYRTLDQLIERKKVLERELYLNLRELFSLKVDLVFYDLTSSYFEGKGPAQLGAFGHSRDGKPRNRQVLVGVVMVEGWPIAHHVFRGNLRDANTVPSVLKDLEERFGLRRVVFVGDRGMVTSNNLALLKQQGQGYLVGLNRRRREQVYRYIEQATGPWIQCPVGITAREKTHPPRTQVQEVHAEDGVRVFVVQSEDRLTYERAERCKAMERVRTQLEALERRVTDGRLKDPAKIGAAAARVLQRHHGYRYYDWEYASGRFRYFEHPMNLQREQAYEGKYVIQTEEQSLSPVEAVSIYKELSDVERAFRNLKDVIELRPIYHRTDDRVEAHVFVAALAFLLQRAVEKKLKAAKLDFSATEAFQTLRTVKVVDIQLPDGTRKRAVTRGCHRASQVLAALGITDLNPPRLESCSDK